MAVKTNVYDQTGKKVSTQTLNAELFDVPANPQLLALAIRVYQANQRQGTKSTQTRAQVNYSTAKIWRQKGTGRARHGSRRAPIFVGGGRAHGPTGNENYRKKLTKNMRRQALKHALTAKQQANQLIIIKNLGQIPPKTKDVNQLLQTIFPSSIPQNILLIMEKPHSHLLKATRNLQNIHTTQASRLNVYEILNHRQLIISPEALDVLEETFIPKMASNNKQSTS